MSNPNNNHIISQFQTLIKQIKHDIDISPSRKESLKNYYRLQRITDTLNIIKKYPTTITSGEQLKDIKGIGKGSIDRIDEIIKTGRLQEITIHHKEHQQLAQIDTLKKIIGIGRKLAAKLVTQYHITSIEQLKQAIQNNTISVSQQVLTGLKYEGVYQMNIPRNEIDQINMYLKTQIKQISPKIKLKICGSYRRQKPFSNDIDVLITHTNIPTKIALKSNENYLRSFVKLLKSTKFILDDLTDKDYQIKYMGFCQYNNNPVRRIDIRYVPYNSYPTALLYFTGSGEFNKRMRSTAISLGLTLNEYGLYKYKNGIKYQYKIRTEKDVFDKLGLEYITPDKRDIK